MCWESGKGNTHIIMAVELIPIRKRQDHLIILSKFETASIKNRKRGKKHHNEIEKYKTVKR